MTKRVYVASSWKNENHNTVVAALVAAGYRVYDYRKAVGFQWSDTGADFSNLTPETFVMDVMRHPAVLKGLDANVKALGSCDICVLMIDEGAGKSSHFNMGLAAGMGKRTVIFAPIIKEPELMYGVCEGMAADIPSLLEACEALSVLDDEITKRREDETKITSAEDVALLALEKGMISGSAPEGKLWAVIVGTNGYAAAAAFDWTWLEEKLKADGERGAVEYERIRSVIAENRDYIAVIPSVGPVTIVVPFDLPADPKRTASGKDITPLPDNTTGGYGLDDQQ